MYVLLIVTLVGALDIKVTCACSAGPAFEGGQVKFGMPAAAGAIENFKFTDGLNIKYNVIGESAPKGICGSGLIDFLAESFIHGYVERNGTINKNKAKDKYIQDETGKGIIIVNTKDCFWDRDMVDKASEKMTYIELNAEPGYMNEYSASLFLPHTNIKLFPSVENLLKQKQKS